MVFYNIKFWLYRLLRGPRLILVRCRSLWVKKTATDFHGIPVPSSRGNEVIPGAQTLFSPEQGWTEDGVFLLRYSEVSGR